ncbi:hypothetical protein BT96DRAFT_835545, partial [Gymnopus androsaceus JB14]
LQTGHSPLYQHLYHIKQVDSPMCPCCKRKPKTVFHYLMECPSHCTLQACLRLEVPRNKWTISALLTNSKTLKHLFRYVNNTGRFRHIEGELPLWGPDEE